MQLRCIQIQTITCLPPQVIFTTKVSKDILALSNLQTGDFKEEKILQIP